MEVAQPSRSAQEVALYRAAHQLLDRPLIFEDPLATRIIGAKAEASLRADPSRFAGGAEIRAFLALRSKYAEQVLARAVKHGVKQYVVLGAGLDTFAYRNRHDIRVFEVDHPATQAWKQQRLAEAGIDIPDSLTFVQMEFAKSDLCECLMQADFDPGRPALFSFLGVVIFLSELVVLETIEFIASCPSPSGVVFDYGVVESQLTAEQLNVRQIAARQSAAHGEPFVTFLDPKDLTTDLKRMGFSRIQDFGSEEANARYFKNRTDGLTVGSSGRRIVGASK